MMKTKTWTKYLYESFVGVTLSEAPPPVISLRGHFTEILARFFFYKIFIGSHKKDPEKK